MTPLTQEYLDQCPIEGVFRQRGVAMTRIEVFVDAAFAFAVTMLVISFDAIPRNWDEIVIAIKSIPAFVVAVAQLVWIWHTHSVWSRRYGLDDTATVVLSTALLIVVLVYIYPMRIMAGGMFGWMTNEFLPQPFQLNSWDELAGMFVFLGTGFSAVCLVFILLYRHAAQRHGQLLLNTKELYETRSIAQFWSGALVIGVLSIVAALVLPPPWIPLAGFIYVLLGAWGPLMGAYRHRRGPGAESDQH